MTWDEAGLARLAAAVFGDDGTYNLDGVREGVTGLREPYAETLHYRFQMAYVRRVIGAEMGASNANVRAREMKALRMLRHPSRSKAMRLPS